MEDRQYYEGAPHYDRETLKFFDVAHEGAQLRIMARAVQQLEHLRGTNPRSIVVIATDQFAYAAVNALIELRAPLPLPILVTSELPGYVGALDVVVVVGDASDSEAASRALMSATRRGAETVLAGPARGPLIDDAPDGSMIIPSLPTAAGPSPMRAFGGVAAVLDSVTQPVEVIGERLSVIAADVDGELEILSPERDASVNVARQLREFSTAARIIHTGFDATGAAVARAAAHIWSARGIPSGFVERNELASATEDAAGTAGVDIFHDPFIDGGEVLLPVRTVMWNRAETIGAHSRSESCEPSTAGEDSTAARLIVRALATTAMNVPAE